MPDTTKQHRTYTMDQIKQANRDAGQHWFSPDSMRFFRSRVGSTTYGPDSTGIIYFVSSEQRGWTTETGRAYSVRSFDPKTSRIDTVGEFNSNETRAQAISAARKASRS